MTNPTFFPEEYQARLRSVRTSMLNSQLDVLVSVRAENIFYLTDLTAYEIPGDAFTALLITHSTLHLFMRELEATNSSRCSSAAPQLAATTYPEDASPPLQVVGLAHLLVSLFPTPTPTNVGYEAASRRMSASEFSLF